MRPRFDRVWAAMAATIAVQLLVTQCQAADPPPRELLGRWRSAGTTSSGLGSIFIFRSDGVVDRSAGAVVEDTYRIEGDELIGPSTTVNGPEMRQKILFTGPNRLRLDAFEFTREGIAPDPSNPIAGEWIGDADAGSRRTEVRRFFYANGKTLMVWPFVQLTPGRFSVEGSTLRLEFPDQSPVQGKFRIEGDVLALPATNGKEDRLQRY